MSMGLFAMLASRNPQLAARLLASKGIDLTAPASDYLSGGQGAEELIGGAMADVLAPSASSAPAPTPTPAPTPAPTGPTSSPIPAGAGPTPKPPEAPTAPPPAAAAPSPDFTGLAAAGPALLAQAGSPGQRAPAGRVEQSRGIQSSLSQLLALLGSQPQSPPTLGSLLRGL